MVTDIGAVGVAVILYLPPGGLIGIWSVGVSWCAHYQNIFILRAARAGDGQTAPDHAI